MKNSKLIAVAIVALIAACTPCKSYSQNAHYSGFADLGFSTGGGYYGLKQIFITSTHGVSVLSDKLFFGAGTAIGTSVESNIGQTYMLPIYAASRYTFNKSCVKPFVDLKIGYAGMWNEDTDGGGDTSGGLYIAPSVGITTNAGKIDFNIAIGYSVICAEYEEYYEPTPVTNKYNAGGLFLTVGISF